MGCVRTSMTISEPRINLDPRFGYPDGNKKTPPEIRRRLFNFSRTRVLKNQVETRGTSGNQSAVVLSKIVLR